jgi:hypothetical protein
MSHFYGILRNPGRNRISTRCGHKSRGLVAEARTWTHLIQVELTVYNGKDWATLWIGSPYGKTDYAWRTVLWSGPVADMARAFAAAFPDQEEVQVAKFHRKPSDSDPLTGTEYGDLT